MATFSFFDDEFYSNIVAKKEEFENMAEREQVESVPQVYDTNVLNCEISFNEVSKAIDRSKVGKSYLELPNEVLKNASAKNLLHKFFNLCFASGLNPNDWSLSDIKPIPKPDKDPRDPLNNRCITILCCVAKIYSSILNARLQRYLILIMFIDGYK